MNDPLKKLPHSIHYKSNETTAKDRFMIMPIEMLRGRKSIKINLRSLLASNELV